MEITLILQSGVQIAVLCNDQLSHTFDWTPLIPKEGDEARPQPLVDPITYGKSIYQALFPADSLARRTLSAERKRILLVTSDDGLQVIPWEYVHDGERFIVTDLAFVRGLPKAKRIPAPELKSGMHIVAVPSNPLDKDVPPLNIDGEWLRLTEVISELENGATLERVRPPTIDRLSEAAAGQRDRVIHFMGHGGQHQTGAVLLFENDKGAPEGIRARDFVQQVGTSAFLVTLNACVSATPGDTKFANLAAALIAAGTPYALGMRFSIADDDARDLSRSFYGQLARGVPVEDAVRQARYKLSRGDHAWAVGVPVLYTALDQPAGGFPRMEGTPHILDKSQPKLDVIAIPRAEGVFQGRVDKLRELGEALTGDTRPRVLTIHALGGQGKTALAREAVERFAWAWQGGVWAISLENLPTRAAFVSGLARFLGIDPNDYVDPAALEKTVLERLTRRTLLVLDNAETLTQAVQRSEPDAVLLARFLREDLSGTRAHLLVTSREVLSFTGEVTIELGGLQPDEGAALFADNASSRNDEIDMGQARLLSGKVDGHPLSLRLLAGAFNTTKIALADLIDQYEKRLTDTTNPYFNERHKSIYAAMDTSIRALPAAMRDLLSGLWVFHAPFLAETAAAIFDPETQYAEGDQSPILDQLHQLWARGLLERERITREDGNVELYRLLPTVRLYLEQYLLGTHERTALLRRFGDAYADLARTIYGQLDRSPALVYIAQQAAADLMRGLDHVEAESEAHGYYLLHRGWVLGRLGDRAQGLLLTEKAKAASEGKYARLELEALNNLALVYRAIGQPTRALELYEQALPIRRAVGDRAGEATTLNNLAGVYSAIGQPTRALELYEQALPIMRAVGDRAGEGATLNGIAYVQIDLGRFTDALIAFDQSIHLEQQVHHPAGEAAGLVGKGILLYQQINQKEAAIASILAAVQVLQRVGLDRDAAGHTIEQLSGMAQAMRTGTYGGASSDSSIMPAEQLRVIVSNTIAVLTSVKEKQSEWRSAMASALQNAQSQGADWQIEVEFFSVVLALLEGRSAALPADHPYAAALQQIQTGIAQGGISAADDASADDEQKEAAQLMETVQAFVFADDWDATRRVVESQQAILFRPEVEQIFEMNIQNAGDPRMVDMLKLHLALLRDCKANGIEATFARINAAQSATTNAAQPDFSVPPDFVTRCAAALKGAPNDKAALFGYLAGLPTDDPSFAALVGVVKTALFMSDPAFADASALSGIHADTWQTILTQFKGDA